MATIRADEVQVGDIVRLLPRCGRRRVTVSITGPWDGAIAIWGYRCKLEPGGGSTSWGHKHAYFCRAEQEVELLRR